MNLFGIERWQSESGDPSTAIDCERQRPSRQREGGASLDDIRRAANADPEKVASLLKRWLGEEGA